MQIDPSPSHSGVPLPPPPAVSRAPTPQPYESFPSISIEYGQSMPSMPAVSRAPTPQSFPQTPVPRAQTPVEAPHNGRRALVIGAVAAIVVTAGIAIAMYI
jgi:hypothetical protein